MDDVASEPKTSASPPGGRPQYKSMLVDGDLDYLRTPLNKFREVLLEDKVTNSK